MTRLSRSRVAVTTGFALGTATLGMAFAPAALAALIAPTAPASVVAGVEFTVSGAGCSSTDPENPAVVALVTDSTSQNAEEVIFGDFTQDDGSWTLDVSFPAGTPAGAHEMQAACGTQYGEEAELYPVINLTVTTPAAPTSSTPAPVSSTPAPAPAPAKGTVIKGTAANTAGIAPTSSSVAASAVVPGKQITKVLKGFQPHEVVTLVMHSTPTVLGTFTADANGVVTATFTIPAGTAAADHTFVYEGNMGSYYQETVHVGTALATASSDLAYTGADVALPLTVGVGLLALGGGALVVSRRRTGALQA